MGKKEEQRFSQIEKTAAELASKLDHEMARIQKEFQTKMSQEIAGMRKSMNDRFETMEQFDEWTKDSLGKTSKSITDLSVKLATEADKLRLEAKASTEIVTGKMENAQKLAAERLAEEAEKRHKVKRSFDHFVELFKEMKIEERFGQSNVQVDVLAKTVANRVAEINENLDQFRERFQVMESEINEAMGKVDEARATLEREMAAQSFLISKELPRRIDKCHERIASNAELPLSKMRGEFEQRFRKHGMELLQLRNSHTRTVVWRVRNFREKLWKMLTDTKRSIWSPDFCVVSLPPMALQLKVHPTQSKKTGPGGAAQGDERQAMIRMAASTLQAVPLPGLCSLRLWARPNVQVSFRVAVGDQGDTDHPTQALVSRRYEYLFPSERPPVPEEFRMQVAQAQGRGGGSGDEESGEESSGAAEPDAVEEGNSCRVCFNMPNFCTLDQVWDKYTDSLTITFEVHEMRSPMQAEEKVFPEEFRRLPGGAEANAPDDPAVIPEGMDEDDAPANLNDVETLSLMRELSSESGIIAKVGRELEVVKSKWVRRVEWRIDGVVGLLEAIEHGVPVHSSTFAAAGVGRMQLHFYPKGYDDVPEGFCSLYLCCPPCTTLKYVLSVGKQSRTLEHTWERRGEVCGRSRMCQLEHQIDRPGDSLLIALEILEARTDLTDLSLLKPGGPGKTKGEVPTRTGGYEGPPAPTHSVLRIRRADPGEVEEFIHTASQSIVSKPAMGGLSASPSLPALGGKPASLSSSRAQSKKALDGGDSRVLLDGTVTPGTPSRPGTSSGVSTRPPSSGIYGTRPASTQGFGGGARPPSSAGVSEMGSRPNTATLDHGFGRPVSREH